MREAGARLIEPLTQRRARAKATSYRPDQADRVRELALAAWTRLRAAGELRDESALPAALSLLRQAATLAAAAVLAAQDAGDISEPTGDLLGCAERVARSQGARLPEGFAQVRQLLGGSDELELDRLDRDRARVLLPVAEASVRGLLSVIEWRTVQQIRRQGAVRAGLLVAALLAALVGLIAYLARPTNLAEGKPVASSSVRPGTPHPSGLVDGVIRGSFGVHTSTERNPHVSIDLLAPRRLREVVVYHRGDGYWEESLPLTLQLSEDGTAFRDVATRREIFTQTAPWVVRLDESARYVRLIKKGRGYIALSEVEIYEG